MAHIPHSFHLGFRCVLIKIYLGKPYIVSKISLSSFRCYLHFCYGFLFRGDISFRKNDGIQSFGSYRNRILCYLVQSAIHPIVRPAQ
jgi:hypothetical protein